MEDKTKGDAAGYMLKYVLKHTYNDRIKTWASTYSIRQFQQIGEPSVEVWRELYRLDPETVPPDLKPFCLAVHTGDWKLFFELMGGAETQRKDMPLKVYFSLEFDADTGELLDCPLNEYDEPVEGRIFGLLFQGEEIHTRFDRWTVKLKENEIKPPD